MLLKGPDLTLASGSEDFAEKLNLESKFILEGASENKYKHRDHSCYN